MPAITLMLLPLFGLLFMLCISKLGVCNIMMHTASCFAKMLHICCPEKHANWGIACI